MSEKANDPDCRRSLPKIPGLRQAAEKAATGDVAGDPDMPVSNVVANWGYTAGPKGIRLLARPDVDVLVVDDYDGSEFDAAPKKARSALVVPVMYSLLDRRKDVRTAESEPVAEGPDHGSGVSRAVQAS